MSAQRTWRRLNGSDRLVDVVEGVEFEDGAKVEMKAA